ncbi:MAG: helix-turn-helix domain-containing protein [Nanoarchaeota archaeon]
MPKKAGLNLPQEIEVWYVLPAIRKEFTLRMIKGGMKQKDAAEKLGITEAAVSQYVNKKRASEVKLDDKILKEISGSVKQILKGASVINEIQKICHLIKSEGCLCDIHRKYGNPPKDCKICV